MRIVKIRQTTPRYCKFALVLWSCFPEKLRQITVFLSMKIYIHCIFFYSPNSAKITELVILRKMQYFRHEILAFFAILPILSYLHFWDFPPRKKCVNSLSSSKNTRKMTVIKTLMARLAYTRKIFI